MNLLVHWIRIQQLNFNNDDFTERILNDVIAYHCIIINAVLVLLKIIVCLTLVSIELTHYDISDHIWSLLMGYAYL